MSTRSTIWLGTDEKSGDCHLYWELAERTPKAAPIYLEIEASGRRAVIRLPREVAEQVRSVLCPDAVCGRYSRTPPILSVMGIIANWEGSAFSLPAAKVLSHTSKEQIRAVQGGRKKHDDENGEENFSSESLNPLVSRQR